MAMLKVKLALEGLWEGLDREAKKSIYFKGREEERDAV